MRRVQVVITFDVPDAATDREIDNVIADATVQIEEPVTDRPDDGSDVTAWPTSNVSAVWLAVPLDAQTVTVQQSPKEV